MSEFLPESAFRDPGHWVRRVRRAVNNALKGKAGLSCVLAVLVAAGWVYSVDWKEISGSLAAGRVKNHHPADPALLAEAKKLALDYETVAAAPQAYAGKPVAWCITEEYSTKRTMVRSNGGWIVNLTGSPLPGVYNARMSHCVEMLAAIEKSDVPGVHLRFAGLP